MGHSSRPDGRVAQQRLKLQLTYSHTPILSVWRTCGARCWTLAHHDTLGLRLVRTMGGWYDEDFFPRFARSLSSSRRSITRSRRNSCSETFRWMKVGSCLGHARPGAQWSLPKLKIFSSLSLATPTSWSTTTRQAFGLSSFHLHSCSCFSTLSSVGGVSTARTY